MSKRRAQTVLEFGLFGAIILVVFGTIVAYTQRLNDRQYTLMENFRTALKKAHDENAAISYTTLEDRFNVNIHSPFEKSRSTPSASSQVYWAVPYAGESPNSNTYYRVNDEEFTLGEDEELDHIDFAYNTEIRKVFEKEEERETIATSLDVDVEEDRTYEFLDEDDNVIKTINQRVSTGGSKRWETVY